MLFQLLRKANNITLFKTNMSFLNQVLELVIGMATKRVWDGQPLPHFPPGYIIFFPSPSQTWGGASWCPPCPFTKELIIPSLSLMCFWGLCFYRTWVSRISINTIWVLIFKLQKTSFQMIQTLTTPMLCCLLIHI